MFDQKYHIMSLFRGIMFDSCLEVSCLILFRGMVLDPCLEVSYLILV